MFYNWSKKSIQHLVLYWFLIRLELCFQTGLTTKTMVISDSKSREQTVVAYDAVGHFKASGHFFKHASYVTTFVLP